MDKPFTPALDHNVIPFRRPVSKQLEADNPRKPEVIECWKCGSGLFHIVDNGVAVCANMECGESYSVSERTGLF